MQYYIILLLYYIEIQKVGFETEKRILKETLILLQTLKC